ncbi:MAG: acetolactate decarboxylase, partial [Bdellovibrionales bacterium]|nr:acetolactate decarboxylase [Bdellovibrionales bacterium]
VFFKPEQTVKLKSAKSFAQFSNMFDHFITAHNTPHAIKVTGSFRYIKLRSLKEQSPPYQPLMENVYEFHDIEGTLVGFWFPPYLDGINVGGYHFHFIDEKKQWGGHVLDFSLKSGTAELQTCYTLTIDFPPSEAFNHANLEAIK